MRKINIRVKLEDGSTGTAIFCTFSETYSGYKLLIIRDFDSKMVEEWASDVRVITELP